MSDPQDPFLPLPEAQAQAQPLPQAQPFQAPPQMQQPPQVPPFVAPPPFSQYGHNPFGGLRPDDGSAARAQGARMMAIGAILAVVGIVITAGTYSSAASSSSGGTYFIAYGPIIFGVIRFFQGLVKYSSTPRSY